LKPNILENQLLAVLFASGEPIETERLAAAVNVDIETVVRLISHLNDQLDDSGSPLQVLRLDSTYQLCTRSEYAEVIKAALEIKRNIPLSQAAMEVLAIIAYNQPVTKSFVEQVRGVDSASVVNTLAEKGLIEECGRLELPGRPVSYATTANFLRCFSMSSIGELPQIPQTEPDTDEQPQEEQETEELDGQLEW